MSTDISKSNYLNLGWHLVTTHTQILELWDFRKLSKQNGMVPQVVASGQTEFEPTSLASAISVPGLSTL